MIFYIISELPCPHYGSLVKSDSSEFAKQNEPSEFGDLLRARAHDGLQPKPALGDEYHGAHPDPQVLDRDLAQKCRTCPLNPLK